MSLEKQSKKYLRNGNSMAIHFCYFCVVGRVRYKGRPFLPNACTSRSFSVIFVMVVDRDYFLGNACVRFLFKSSSE